MEQLKNQFSPSITIGHLAICTTGVLLGFIPLFKNNLVDDFSSVWIVFFRICIAFLAISILLLLQYFVFGYRTKFLIRTKSDLVGLCTYGVVCITAVNYFYIKSLTLTTATVSVVTVFAVLPFSTLIANALLGNEKTSFREVLFITIIAFGCFLVTVQSASISGFSGIVHAAAAGVCYGLYSIIGKRVATTHDYPVMMFWQFGFALVSSILLLLTFRQDGHVPVLIFFDLISKNILSIFAIGFIATFLPYFLYSFGLRQGVKASSASALTMLEPISAAIVAYLFLHESLTTMQIIGSFIVVLFSILLAKTSSNK